MRRALVSAALVAVPAYVVLRQLWEYRPGGALAGDVYNYFYPNMLYALRSLAAGGAGLLWNPFQNCGQPFFGITSTGLLYPGNLLFLALEPPIALRALLLGNLVVGSLGVYGLGREIGLSTVGALGGAIAFVLGSATYHATTWMPTVQGPYVWMPVAMWLCERLVKAPSLRDSVLLGVVLAVSLLPGHPQFVFFTCLLIGLRLLWAVLDGSERRQLPRATAAVALAVVFMVLLAAVQYLPGYEVAAESLRSHSLLPKEIEPRGRMTMEGIASNIRQHFAMAPFTVVPGFLAAAALTNVGRRRAALFYLLAGTLALVLSLGDGTALGRLYLHTPIGQLFRFPIRFLFVTGFCSAVLAGLAIDVLARGSWRALAVAAAGVVVLYAWLGGFMPVDWWTAGAVLAGSLVAAAVPVARPIGAAAVLGAVVLAPVILPHRTLMLYLADDGPLYAHAGLLARLNDRLTPQDRVHVVRRGDDPTLEDKTAMLFAVHAIADYEPQISERYAEFMTMLQTGQPLRSLNQVSLLGRWEPRAVRWPLLDLAAARYLLIPQSLDQVPPLSATHVDGDGGVHVYENPSALPRAYYVPAILVVADRETRLRRLASGTVDLRRLALVDAAPASGFLGVPGNVAEAGVRFVVDDPERVVLEAVAPERGFVFMADQYFPGWSATVNGHATPILVGNHAFRLVEVPAGPVTVEFRYRPRFLWVGALLSSGALLVAAVLLSPFPRRNPP